MGAIAGFIVALAKAIPAVRDIYLQSVDLYFAAEERQDQTQMNDIEVERSAIVRAIQQPGLTDAQIRIFRKRLISLSRL